MQMQIDFNTINGSLSVRSEWIKLYTPEMQKYQHIWKLWKRIKTRNAHILPIAMATKSNLLLYCITHQLNSAESNNRPIQINERWVDT